MWSENLNEKEGLMGEIPMTYRYGNPQGKFDIDFGRRIK